MLVTSESKEGTRQSTACLVRLMRYVSLRFSMGHPEFSSGRSHSGLLFTCRALENMQADRTSELRACFKRSYDDVLKHHHGWFVQSAVTVRVDNARFERNQTFILFLFRPFLFALSVGHQSSPIPIRVLQADIAGRVVRETGHGTGQMAQRPRPDRRPHEALPGRRWSWYGIESGAARRLSSFVIHSVDHTFQKLSTGRRK